MKRAEATVADPAGLHARPAALFVRTAARYRSRVRVRNLSRDGPSADAKSLLAVLGLGVERGHRIEIEATGEDEGEAVDGLARVVAPSGEAVTPPQGREPERDGSSDDGRTATAADGRHLRGIPGAPGVALAPVWRFGDDPGRPGAAPAPDLTTASSAAADELVALAADLRERDRPEEAAILEAQAAIATDSVLLDAARAEIGRGLAAAEAVERAAAREAARLAALESELLRARAVDVRDVGARVARRLRGQTAALPGVPSIVVAADLPPSAVVEIPDRLLAGIALEGGSRTAHAAILARGLGIPAVLGVTGLLAAVPPRADLEAGIDGDSGEVVLRPMPAERARFEGPVESKTPVGPIALADGSPVHLLANLDRPADVGRALAPALAGVGLFRTEFLFMGRDRPPTEDEQAEAYAAVLRAMGPHRPVVVRLVDIGGDKDIPYLRLPREDNPFLGVRAIRLAYRTPDLLTTQLRAVLRAATDAGVEPHVMAPMVATADDVSLLRRLIGEAREGLVARGAPVPERVVTGIMVEVPSAVLLAPELARVVDFFSIGTNDLTQYLLAADRGNAALDALHDALQPAVLRAIAMVVRAADEAGIPVAVCGELAADPAGAAVLLGLGVDELSVAPAAVPRLAAALTRVTRDELATLARDALADIDARTVRERAARLLAAEDAGRTRG